MTHIARPAAAFLAFLCLLAPALWNGFPLLQYDTGGYFARWYEGTLEVSRSTVYGLFLNLLSWPDFWPVVAAQAAATVWVVLLVLRVHGLGGRALIVTIAALSVVTALPWLTSLLLTDIFTGLGILALYLVGMRAAALAPWERAALVALVAFAAAVHSATLAVLLMLVTSGLLVALFDRTVVPLRGVAHGMLALALGAGLLLAANYAVVQRLAWTPGGIALTFGRMLNDGIVKRYLAERCPDPRFRLCDHQNELPTNADVFFWGESVFDRLGRFEGMNDEMRAIVLESLVAYPWLQFNSALIATARQLVKVATGYGVHTEVWHTYNMIGNFAPAMLPAMEAARQQKGGIDFVAINSLHVPVAFASMLLLGTIALRRRRDSDLGQFGVVVALAILANAFVCGALSNPNDRYGARIVWLATLVVLIAPWRASVPGAAARSTGATSSP